MTWHWSTVLIFRSRSIATRHRCRKCAVWYLGVSGGRKHGTKIIAGKGQRESNAHSPGLCFLACIFGQIRSESSCIGMGIPSKDLRLHYLVKIYTSPNSTSHRSSFHLTNSVPFNKNSHIHLSEPGLHTAYAGITGLHWASNWTQKSSTWKLPSPPPNLW